MIGKLIFMYLIAFIFYFIAFSLAKIFFPSDNTITISKNLKMSFVLSFINIVIILIKGGLINMFLLRIVFTFIVAILASVVGLLAVNLVANKYIEFKPFIQEVLLYTVLITIASLLIK